MGHSPSGALRSPLGHTALLGTGRCPASLLPPPEAVFRTWLRSPGEICSGPLFRLRPNAHAGQRLPASIEVLALREGTGRGPPPQTKSWIAPPHTPGQSGGPVTSRIGSQFPARIQAPDRPEMARLVVGIESAPPE
ncbi:hypothetical protein NDU88_007095 [Pleurodeles waltl]|uniref:Uncharacterized protein n=1 Tax=Pleurodeles waltl TaxID=8319 RepID=A0AAV7RQU5_PLEWA|nr:hypothetical protein NDU88_007095 [Pleurodeles waltl]